jgi:ABC-type methionine transport system ATPase subunit
MGQKKQSRYSGGKRVVIARALANHPHIILNDEPTVALNVISGLRGAIAILD